MFSGKSTTAKGEQAHANAAPGTEMQQDSAQQPLSIGAVNDPMEQEADLMADGIMRMPESPVIQRRCACCEEDRPLQRKSLSAGIAPFIQTKANEGAATASDAVTTQINDTRGGGNSLPGPTKTFMESRFGS